MPFFYEIPEEESNIEHLPSDYEIEEISADSDSLAYGFYSILTTYKDHFQNLQNKLKGLTVTWVLATFIGIGYVMAGYEIDLQVNPFLIILFLSLLASQGVFLLWFLDVGVYDKLVKSVWFEIYKLEEKFPIIGQSHHIIAKLLALEKEPIKFHGLFYIYFIIFFIFIAIISIGFYLYYINPLLILITIPIAVIISLILYIMFKKIIYSMRN